MIIKIDNRELELSYDEAEMLYDKLNKLLGPEAVEINCSWDEVLINMGEIGKN